MKKSPFSKRGVLFFCMYLFFIVWLELYLLWVIPWQISISLIMFYLLWYLDGKEYTGERRWEAFRSLRIWHWFSPIDAAFSDKHDIQNVSGKRVFIFTHCYTPSPIIWSVGLHGDSKRFSTVTHYIVPPVFMWIPIVRDVLLWTGAITYSNYNERHNKQTVIADILLEHRSVAYAPSNLADKILGFDLEASIESRFPQDDTLKMLIDRKLQVVPVVVQGEFDRYKIIQHEYVKYVQRFLYKYLDCVFILYWYRWYAHSKPPLVTVQFGPVMLADAYTTPPQLKDAIKDRVSRLVQPTGGGENKDIKSM